MPNLDTSPCFASSLKLVSSSYYLEIDAHKFSEEHLYFNDEGFNGFSDYTVIPSEYNETGSMPRAVVIHLTYLKENKYLTNDLFLLVPYMPNLDTSPCFASSLKLVSSSSMSSSQISRQLTGYGVSYLEYLKKLGNDRVYLPAFRYDPEIQNNIQQYDLNNCLLICDDDIALFGIVSLSFLMHYLIV
jgi:hypothetical protein